MATKYNTLDKSKLKKTIVDYMNKNYTYRTFAIKHKMHSEAVWEIMNGAPMSDDVMFMLRDCITCVDGHDFYQ